MPAPIVAEPTEIKRREKISFKRLLLANDFSEASALALGYGNDLCKRDGLSLIHL